MNADAALRLVSEHEALSDKYDKLSAFIDSDKLKELSDENQVLLIMQSSAMNDYRNILKRRMDINGIAVAGE